MHPPLPPWQKQAVGTRNHQDTQSRPASTLAFLPVLARSAHFCEKDARKIMDTIPDQPTTGPDPAEMEPALPAPVPLRLPEPGAPAEHADARYGELTCTQCGTTAHLDVEDVHSLESNADGQVMTEYSCTSCGAFYAHEVSVQDLAKYLAIDATTGVLKFGRHYIHCGMPMQEAKMNLFPTTRNTSFNIEPTSLDPDVTMPSRVLKCRCGFQISMPQ